MDSTFVSNIIAIIAIIVTIVLSAFGVVKNRKKYELTQSYRRELMDWYNSVLNIMIQIIHLNQSNVFNTSEFKKERINLLSKLSSLIESGRFYFPNVVIDDNLGVNKPSAYQGHRHINLQFVKHFYNIASKDDICNADIQTLWELERHFTSFMFDVIDPRKRNKEFFKHLSIRFPEDKYIKNYIKEHPDSKQVFYSSSTKNIKKQSKQDYSKDTHCT